MLSLLFMQQKLQDIRWLENSQNKETHYTIANTTSTINASDPGITITTLWKMIDNVSEVLTY